jgi:hypothetical protein
MRNLPDSMCSPLQSIDDDDNLQNEHLIVQGNTTYFNQVSRSFNRRE